MGEHEAHDMRAQLVALLTAYRAEDWESMSRVLDESCSLCLVLDLFQLVDRALVALERQLEAPSGSLLRGMGLLLASKEREAAGG